MGYLNSFFGRTSPHIGVVRGFRFDACGIPNLLSVVIGKPTIIFALVLVLTLAPCQWMQSDGAPPSTDIAVRAGNIGGLGCGLVLGLGCGLVG